MGREQLATAVFLSIVGALLLLPPLALFLFRALRAGAPRALRPAVFGCAGLLALILLAATAGFGLWSRTAGCYAVLIAYGAFCFLVAAAPSARPQALGIAAATVGWASITLGYFAATFGFLPLGWVVMGYLATGSPTEQVAPGMACETSWWGMAATDNGYVQHIYEEWPLGVRRQVASFPVMQTDPADPEVSCSEAYRRYHQASDG